MAPKEFLDTVKAPDCKLADDGHLKKGGWLSDIGGRKPLKWVNIVWLSDVGGRQPLKWVNIVSIASLHLLALYGVPYIFYATWLTWLFYLFYGFTGGFGVTGGAHRLWTHKTYKAKLPLRILLAACYSVAGQNTLPDWVRDHRVHHKFSETDADPHNSNRGFFFAHVGWLMQKKHPEVIRRGKEVDMSDIYADPVIYYHTKYFTIIKIILCFGVSILVPYYFWNEKMSICIFGTIFRYTCGLNATWLVNSLAHLQGYHPFSTRIRPAENKLVSLITLGEGWHNYHHVFPWDYKAAEMGHLFYNTTTVLLDMFASIGWAYDMKQPSKDLVERIARRYGDGTHPSVQHPKEVDEDGKEVEETLFAEVTVAGNIKSR